MRIIRGTHKGRRINPPANLPVRPTTDLAKESLFNILEQYFYFDELEVLDLFAGTGNISFEFASRGARQVVAVDINDKCLNFIRSIASKFEFDNLRVIKSSTLNFIRLTARKYDVIFADPPYDLDRLDEMVVNVFKKSLLLPQGMLVVEHSSGWDFSEMEWFFDVRKYGRVHFSFFTNNGKEPEG
jgi:16S rRNA (guanine(966)-N(2))-methyltransferase RsmD